MSYIYSPNSGATISQNLPMTPKKLPLLSPTHFITATNASQMEGEGHATGSLPSQNQLKITWCFQVQIVLRLLQFPSKQETQNKLFCACFEANCSMPRTIWTWKRSQIRLPNAVWISFFACALLTFLCTHRGVPSFCVVPWKTSILSPCPRPQVNDELHRNFPHFDACNVWINLYIYIYSETIYMPCFWHFVTNICPNLFQLHIVGNLVCFTPATIATWKAWRQTWIGFHVQLGPSMNEHFKHLALHTAVQFFLGIAIIFLKSHIWCA